MAKIPRMTRFPGLLALSLNGRIADAAGGMDWLEPFNDADLVDRWELFTIPVLLDGGVRCFRVATARCRRRC